MRENTGSIAVSVRVLCQLEHDQCLDLLRISVKREPGITLTISADIVAGKVMFTRSIGVKEESRSGTICACENACVTLFKSEEFI